jgi:hypothetical protein
VGEEIMPTRQSIANLGSNLFQMIQSLQQAKAQRDFESQFAKEMQPVERNQWMPLQQGQTGQQLPYSPEAIQNNGYNQKSMVQPDIMQALARVVQKNPSNVQYVKPLYEQQIMAGQAAKAGILEQNPGQRAIDLRNGKIYEPPPFKETNASRMDKKIGEYVNKENKKKLIMMRSDNTMYESDAQDEMAEKPPSEKDYQVITGTDNEMKLLRKTTGELKTLGEFKKSPSEISISHIALNDNLESIKAVKEVSDRGDLTGVVKGRALKFGTKFFNNEEAIKLKNRVAQLRTIIYGLSGKQINESEQKWLENDILPQMQNPDENFETTLNEFEAWVKRRKNELEKAYPELRNANRKETQKPNRAKPLEEMTDEELDAYEKELVK